MEVSDRTRELFKEDSAQKNITIRFPQINLILGNEQIREEESFYLKEAVLDSSDVEFVGCLSSCCSVDISYVSVDLKGQYMEVEIQAEDSEVIPLFHGIVDSAPKQGNKQIKKITAYDVLYEKGKIDVSPWYNSIPFPISLVMFRNLLFEFLGIEQVGIDLPNDSVLINKEYAPVSLKALDVIKAICQINGAFGIINREGKFEYRILQDLMEDDGAYPGISLVPPFYPGIGSGGSGREPEYFTYYKDVQYEEYMVKPVDRVTIRQGDSDPGVTYGTGTNNYIIQGNMFTLNKSSGELLKIAERIHENVRNVAYHPFEADNNGLPFLECGKDTVSYYVLNEDGETFSEKSFYLFSRELKGIQALRDVYSAQGEEYQREFITDLQVRIDTIRQSVKEEAAQTADRVVQEYTYPKREIDGKLADTLKAVSVVSVPAQWDANTIYFIQE